MKPYMFKRPHVSRWSRPNSPPSLCQIAWHIIDPYRNPYIKGPKRQFFLNFFSIFWAAREAALAADLITAWKPSGEAALAADLITAFRAGHLDLAPAICPCHLTCLSSLMAVACHPLA